MFSVFFLREKHDSDIVTNVNRMQHALVPAKYSPVTDRELGRSLGHPYPY